MDTILSILNDIDDTIDYGNEPRLIDNHLLDSFGVITLVSELEEAFNIEIDAASMVPENFNNVEAIWNLVQRKQGVSA